MADDQPNPAGATAPGPGPLMIPGGDLPAGFVIGEYRLDAVVGRGGMGVVYSATQPVIEKRVAIKVLNAQYSADPALVRRFTDEARAVNRIRHPNIIDIFSFGQLADGRHYFVMEYLEGSTLGARLDKGTLARDEVPVFLGQICDALDAAHAENIVHRDLKPENIWIVTPRRGRPFVKLLDFGIAKLIAAADQSSTQTGAVMGTPHYMSPEQCHGRAVDHRTDIYAMGVILYRFYAGRLPFEGDTFMEVLTKQVTLAPDPPSLYASIPPALDQLILRCLAKDPAARPQSAHELGAALEALFTTSSLPLAASTPAVGVSTTLSASAAEVPPAPGPPGPRSRRRWAGALGAALVVMVVGAVLAATRHRRPAASWPPAPGATAAAAPTGAPPPPSAPAGAPPPAGAPAATATPPGGPTPAGREAAVAEDVTRAAKRRRGANNKTARPPTGEHPAVETPPRPRTRASESGLARDNPFQ
jgi:eukaryotic-like serine/threonine-protein kinase